MDYHCWLLEVKERKKGRERERKREGGSFFLTIKFHNRNCSAFSTRPNRNLFCDIAIWCANRTMAWQNNIHTHTHPTATNIAAIKRIFNNWVPLSRGAHFLPSLWLLHTYCDLIQAAATFTLGFSAYTMADPLYFHFVWRRRTGHFFCLNFIVLVCKVFFVCGIGWITSASNALHNRSEEGGRRDGCFAIEVTIWKICIYTVCEHNNRIRICINYDDLFNINIGHDEHVDLKTYCFWAKVRRFNGKWWTALFQLVENPRRALSFTWTYIENAISFSVVWTMAKYPQSVLIELQCAS